MNKAIAIILIFFSVQGSAQVLQPAKWSLDISVSEPEIGQEMDLTFNVKIDQDWYLYSSDFDPDLGPLVTTIEFEPHASFELLGGITPVNPQKKYDSLWEGEYTYFKKNAQFTQRVKILSTNPTIKGSYFYQVCTDIDGKCIPFDDEFDFSPLLGSQLHATSVDDQKDKGMLTQRSNNDPYSLLSFMIAAFLAGLAAIFTPCVFPMIPMTVSFFTGNGGGKWKGIFYGFSIILIYTLIGSVLAPFMGAETANELATNWIPNVIFFAVFVVFALSFLGLFEITLPSKFVNNIDKQSDKGGLIGIFFMAFTLVVVSFSCTGPLVGTILVESAGGQILKPILGMFAFSLAFALPFTVFALFPSLLKNLPKSGGWLNSVKVVLGLLELAFAFKFLSIADQAYHWGILDREVYLAIWIVIFTILGLYLLGKIRFPHDSPSDHTSVGGLILAIATLSFVVYLIPGMFGAPLKALAGYLPPQSSQDFNLTASTETHAESTICEVPKYADFLHFPHGIQGYFDYEQALACAKEQNKPVFIDFTGHGCVNCREMEAKVWSDPMVLQRLNEDFVMLALYVDDKTDLPESEWVTSSYDGKIKKSIGKKNADFQIARLDNNAQPYYVILDTNGELLLPPKAYDLNIASFVEFLEQGKRNFKKLAK
ncbi:protein-disulfide reductase DsbD family protein [Reichenbachiella agarivorans]|uniref:Protein-disulfide reductase DsbD family protein n=1 Tax=Reichenbachiella agarivorans TaxID=2979464 RepID=A0ABY6CT72_9BACT|nr:cytochrome c biogenesis protein CcdA [Reichenbachiella agarivorans]UXP33693.1 protein-disulfide reductase DsbD family protein [Reichenbachiella agarivorans]